MDRCSLLVARQSQIDQARLREHQLGLRPYRVQLVWQVQSQVTGKWSSAEVDGGRELELLPVLVRGIGNLDMIVEQSGRGDKGLVTLLEISTAQVDEGVLVGWRDGVDWAENNQQREFFYEIWLDDPRAGACPGDSSPTKRRRMIPAGAPELDAPNFQWKVRLTDQFGERSSAGVDQTVPGSYARTAARLVP